MITPALRLPMCSTDYKALHSSAITVGIAICLALSGCASPPPLPEAKGKFRPINTGRWSPQPEDLKGPKDPSAAPPSSPVR